MGSDQLFQKKKFRKSKELTRTKAKRSPYATIVIICEDSKSVPYYFNELKKHFRLNTANIHIIPSKGSAPISVVEHSVEIARSTSDIDYIACVFDRDHHESYERAVNKLKAVKPKKTDKSKPIYMTITSIPCYEIWLLLHFYYTTKAYNANGSRSSAENLIIELRKHLPSYTKNTNGWFGEIINKLEYAIKHAKQLKKYNLSTNSNNPSTNMHELVEFLIKLKNS